MRDQAWIEKRAADLAGTPGQCPPVNSLAMLQAKREAYEYNQGVLAAADAGRRTRAADAEEDQRAAADEGVGLEALLKDAVPTPLPLPDRTGSSELQAETSVTDTLRALANRNRSSNGKPGPQYGD